MSSNTTVPRYRAASLLVAFVSVLIAACGGGGGGSSPSPTYSVGGTVAGLATGASLVVTVNGGNPLTVSSNSSFTFVTTFTAGSSYNVAVLTQPVNQTCTPTHNVGSVANADVITVLVDCETTGFFVGGTVYGLAAGGSVVLQDNGADSLTVNSNSTFRFPTPLSRLGSYNVTVGTRPTGQTCAVNYATGGALTSDVTNVIVECHAEAVLWSFGSGTDGGFPFGTLIQASDGALYGVTSTGGTFNRGTVFRVTLAGVETVLWNFESGTDGNGPSGALTMGGDGNFYGTTSQGGAYGYGTVYRLTPAGVETVLWNFGAGNDGQNPTGLVLGKDGNFYGTTTNGGVAGYGTVFKITPSGAETILWSFWIVPGDANNPVAPLIQASDGNFYGTSSGGGVADWGTVFQITPAGQESVFYSFVPSTEAPSNPIAPVAPLMEGPDGYLYGTTYDGGFLGGDVVRLSKDGPAVVGSGFEESVLWIFGNSGSTDGYGSQAGLIVAGDGNFYGTTSGGGAYRGGTAFKLTPGGVESVIWHFGGGADASNIQGALLLANDGNFYGLSVTGGANGKGAIFRLSP
jgi:uncharacterized repeat protein (TIGR03803 family)